jgi:hypothetical protein
MSNDIIHLAYPALLRPGMIIDDRIPPEPLIDGIDPDDEQTIIATAVLSLNSTDGLIVSLDILYENESVIENKTKQGYSQTYFLKRANGREFYSTCYYVGGVTFKQEGCYRLLIKTQRKDESGNTIENPTAQIETLFFVSFEPGRSF